MRLPRTFTKEKDLSDKLNYFLYEGKHDMSAVTMLEDLGREFTTNIKDYNSLYNIAKDLTREVRYTLKHVEEFSDRLLSGECFSIGVFLSALVNKIIRNDDIVTLKLKPSLDCIGMNLERGTLIVKGDVRDFAGRAMKSGNLIIEGNANNSTGCSMEGGFIAVKGSAKDYTGNAINEGIILVHGNTQNLAGYDMKGGKLVIEGDAYDSLGNFMNGGEIIIEGNAGSYTGSLMNGGKITVEGRIMHISDKVHKGTIIQGSKVVMQK